MGELSTSDHQAFKMREPGLDLLRSIAILLVVFFHMHLQDAPRFLRPVEQLDEKTKSFGRR
jgi:peptidoglycan/LPS O-acetylase OafA/YrhL